MCKILIYHYLYSLLCYKKCKCIDDYLCDDCYIDKVILQVENNEHII